MVLYSTALTPALSKMIIHRLSINKSKEAVLMIHERKLPNHSESLIIGEREWYETFDRSKINFDSLQKIGLFDKVVLCDSFRGASTKDKKDAIIQAIQDSYNSVFEINNFSLDDFEAFYTANDNWEGEFKVYLTLNKIVCHMLELFPNSLYHMHTMTNNLKGTQYKKVLREFSAIAPTDDFSVPVLLQESNQSQQLLDS